jgi:hypothetical protein
MAIAYNTSVVRDGLVLYLDAANLKSYPGSGATWFNLAGFENNATIVNSIVYNSNSKGAINFDTGNEDIVISTLTSSLADHLSSGNFTVETFVKSTNVVYPRSRHPFYINDTVTSSSTKGWSVGHSSSASTIEVRTCDGTNLSSGTIAHSVQESTTYHRIFTVNRSSGLLTRYYVNGNYIGQFNSPSVTGTIYSSGGIKFGDVWGWRYIGDIYVIKIYNRILSDSEIKNNFESLKGRFGI